MKTWIRFGIFFYLLLSCAAALRAASVVRLGQNFTASVFGTDSSALPPDTQGAAGPRHFVELINGRFAVFEKESGRSVQTMTDLEFWAAAGVSIPATLQVTDPRVVFDTYSQRWFASMVDVNVNARRQRNNRFLIAVSESEDPTGTWRALAFTADPINGYFADFPTLGVDQTGIYLSGDMFTRSGNPVGPLLVVLLKSGLLSDPPDISGRVSSGVLSYDTRGDILQPAVTTGSASSGEFLLAVSDVGVDFQPHTTLVASTVENPNSPDALLSAPTVLQVPAYTIPINPTQPSGSDNLDDGDARFGASVRRVNDLVYAVHAIETNNRAAIRWYKIDATTRTLIEFGTIASTNLDLFYPSIAANERGTVVIGCNGSSRKLFVSCYAFVGETSTTGLTFGEPILLKAGQANYDLHDSSGTSRWGDYSATTVDPVDSNRFWTIQTYPKSGTTWATQVTELIVAPASLAIAARATDIEVSWPANSGFHLEMSSDLIHWSSAIENPTVTDGQASLVLPILTEPRFFRLAQAPSSAG